MGSDSVLSDAWLYSGFDSRDTETLQKSLDYQIIETLQKSYDAVNKYFSTRVTESPYPIGKYLTVKERTLEIGGDICHLCGKPVHYHNYEKKYGKKNRMYVWIHRIYRCGSRYEESYNYKHDGEENKKKKFVIGRNCLRMEGK